MKKKNETYICKFVLVLDSTGSWNKISETNYCEFQAKYKDPRTGIQYNNSMEFGSIRSLPMDIVSGYLALRKAAPTWNMFLIYKCVNKLEFKQRFLNLIFEV